MSWVYTFLWIFLIVALFDVVIILLLWLNNRKREVRYYYPDWEDDILDEVDQTQL